MGFTDSHHFRKMLAGCCMVVGPLLALAAFIVSPAIESGSAAQVAEVARHQDRFLLSGLLSLAAVALVIGGSLGLMHVLRERMVGYGNVGGTFTLLGLIATTAQLGASLMLWSMVRDGVQPADVTAWHSATHDTAAVIPLVAVPWLAVAGFAVLAMGLYRARAGDWWLAAEVDVGPRGVPLRRALPGGPVGLGGAALVLRGLGAE